MMRAAENPWNINSIYELQYFICPTCEFKNQSKQEIINHAYENHPESLDYLTNIKDDSLTDILCPWDTEITGDPLKDDNEKGDEIEDEEDYYMGIDPSMIEPEVCINTEESPDSAKVSFMSGKSFLNIFYFAKIRRDPLIKQKKDVSGLV